MVTNNTSEPTRLGFVVKGYPTKLCSLNGDMRWLEALAISKLACNCRERVAATEGMPHELDATPSRQF